MFNSYVFKSTFKEEKELIFKVMPNYPKSEEIDYTALDLLCYMIRTNIIFDSYQRAYVPRSYEEWNNYVAELDVLLKVRQDEIVDKIIEPVTAENGKTFPKYYETIWYCLYRDKNMELSQNNFDKITDAILNNSNSFEPYNSYHPINLVLSNSNRLSYDKVKKIINECTWNNDSCYFDKIFYVDGIVKQNNCLDWRYYLLDRNDLPMGVKDQILSDYYSDEDLMDAKYMLKQGIENQLSTLEQYYDADSIDADDYIRNNVNDLNIKRNNRVYRYISMELANRKIEKLTKEIKEKQNEIKALTLKKDTYEDDRK